MELNQQPTLISLLKQLRDETMTLLRQEVALAKEEVGQKAQVLKREAVTLAAGGIVALAGAFVLLFAIGAAASAGLVAAGLSETVAAWLGPGIVGLLFVVVGYALIRKAQSTLRKQTLAPERTVETLKEDAQWAKQKLQHQHP